jgi:predicted nucleotide-binding protein
MTPYEELFAIAGRLEGIRASPELAAADGTLSAMNDVATEAGRAFSGSWLGYHAYVYYNDLTPPPPGAHFSQEWGLKDMSFTSMGSRGDWREYNPNELRTYLRTKVGDPDISAVETAAGAANEAFNTAKAEIRSILLTENADGSDVFLTQLLADLDKVQPLSALEIAEIWSPKGQVIIRDMVAANQGTKLPPHMAIMAEVAAIRQAFNICHEASQIGRKAASHLDRKAKRNVRDARIGTNIFIGHGRSSAWRELKDFIQDRLHLPWDEFNRVPVAGVTNQARLSEMLDAAALALVIMTAEDETAEGQVQARMNVIHEVGLFQGRLGFTKAIVLFEEGCQEFSNIQGLGQIRFPAGNIAACFEEVRRVLEREGIVKP